VTQAYNQCLLGYDGYLCAALVLIFLLKSVDCICEL